jgi:hypothetical protein
MNLRVNGVYRLPNDRELVVIAEEWIESSRVYYLEGIDLVSSSTYIVNHEGRVSADGRLTAWDVRDLRDTGRDANRETP